MAHSDNKIYPQTLNDQLFLLLFLSRHFSDLLFIFFLQIGGAILLHLKSISIKGK